MNPWLSALFYGLPSFALGLMAGWLLRQQVTEEVTQMGETGKPVSLRRPMRWPERRMVRRVLTALAIVVLVVTFGSSMLVIYRQNELQNCLTRVADTTSRRLNDASSIAAEDRKAVDDMVKGVLVPGRTPEQRAQVLRDYLQGRHDRDLARAKLPPYPVTAGCPN